MMSTKTWERNASGMIAHARKRREDACRRVDAAISGMIRDGKAMNFNTVAAEAGVTTAYLYSQPPLRERIEALREQGHVRAARERIVRPQGKTDASKDLVILAKERRIKELENEVRRLKQDVHTALGQLYERI